MKPRASAKNVATPEPVLAGRAASTRTLGKVSSKYSAIQEDLERQRAMILEDAGEVLTSRTALDTFPDVTDQASAESDQHFSFRIREREQKLLKKIDEALDRLATNTYGTCEQCGEEIPYKRLKARPVTTLCIECKTQQEEKEKTRR
jgi:DnaK suppressor protein